jgi:hypothetical protein
MEIGIDTLLLNNKNDKIDMISPSESVSISFKHNIPDTSQPYTKCEKKRLQGRFWKKIISEERKQTETIFNFIKLEQKLFWTYSP